MTTMDAIPVDPTTIFTRSSIFARHSNYSEDEIISDHHSGPIYITDGGSDMAPSGHLLDVDNNITSNENRSERRPLRSCLVKDRKRTAYFSMFPVEFSDEAPLKYDVLSRSDYTEEERKSCWWTTAEYGSFDANRLPVPTNEEECVDVPRAKALTTQKYPVIIHPAYEVFMLWLEDFYKINWRSHWSFESKTQLYYGLFSATCALFDNLSRIKQENEEKERRKMIKKKEAKLKRKKVKKHIRRLERCICDNPLY